MDSVRVHITCKPLGMQQVSVRDCREAVAHATLSDFVGKGGSAAVFKYSHWFAKAFDWGERRMARAPKHLIASLAMFLQGLIESFPTCKKATAGCGRLCNLSLDWSFGIAQVSKDVALYRLTAVPDSFKG